MAVELPTYIQAPIKNKLDEIIEKVSDNLPEKAEEAFVSTSSSEGELKYLAVWLFTRRLLVEIRNPLSQKRIHFDLATLRESVDWIRLIATNYEFKEESKDSELILEFTTTDGLSSELSANGQGCTQLMSIYRERILPNFTGIPSAETDPECS